eukprot:CAMPEP_0178711932 /NCGR_PEP_ID=MMETSP0699-20121125/18611_1 /TAXON_ID=265572 /ORGANISM="Extubocellulus spinifer, Strain CCMP396" /LENGTH=656 /DNA_ID=CAMNT_0020360647 /DNA_START=192 /DNA_END=2162 /DNA_ORIENTATION=-
MRLPAIVVSFFCFDAVVYGFHSPGLVSVSSGSSIVLRNAPHSTTTALASSQSVESDAAAAATSSSSSSSSDTPTTDTDMKAYSSGYQTVFEELPCSVCKASVGQIPNDLVGTYFRSGPAMFSAGSILPPKMSLIKPKTNPVPDGQDPDRMVMHPFEGDGAVLGVTFPGDGTAVARFRFVRTNSFTNERKKGRKVYTAMESTRQDGGPAGGGQGNDFPLPMYRHHLLPGLNKKRKNTSNTRAVYFAKKLITLWEGGLPYKLDSLALSTEGRSQLGGILKEKDPFGGAAVYDSAKDRMLFYSNAQDAKTSKLTVYEFNSKFRLVPDKGGIVEADLPGFALLSDFAVTENYSVFFQPPVSTKSVQFLTSKEPAKSLALDQGGALLHLIPRVGSKGARQKTIVVPFDGISDAELQFCNAYEVDEDTIVMDVIRSDGRSATGKSLSWPWATSTDEYSKTSSKKSLWRYKIQISSGVVTKDCTDNVQASFGVINPAVSGKKHRYVYAAVGGRGSDVAPPQGIAKFNIDAGIKEVWMPEGYEFCGEPMFAPKKTGNGEDEGYILSVLYNGRTNESEIVVLDALNIEAGPVSRVPLGIAIPHGYYGCFSATEETGWTAEEIDRRARLADKMESKGNMWNEVKSDFSGLGLRLDDIEEYFGDFFG